MSAIKGDFTGFTFNGIHSSELGLTRVSNSNRYDDNLLPTIQDKTVQVPGGDGTYYFGSFYTQRTFNISVAFDDLTEEQLQRIRKVFGDKKIHNLIFDETPYKIYRVKATGNPNLKYVCFNQDENENDRAFNSYRSILTKEALYSIGPRSSYGRVYKGEGTLTFTAYYPFAHSRYKYIDEYTMANIPEWGSMDSPSANDVHYNLYDWVDSAGLKRSDASAEYGNLTVQIDRPIKTGVMIYNPGDFATDFNLYFRLNRIYSLDFPGCIIGYENNSFFNNHLVLNSFKLKDQDQGFKINGKLNLIEGIIEEAGTEQYIKILAPQGNPKQQNWYEKIDSSLPGVLSLEYRPTMDLTVQFGKDYYQKTCNYLTTGNLYNEFIEEGDFFRIPVIRELTWLPVNVSNYESSVYEIFIEYDYLYY